MPLAVRPPESPVLTARSGPLNAWLRVVNRHSIAIVFYLCLAGALSSGLTMLPGMAFDLWALETVHYLRQTLISGLTMLAAIGAAEVLLEGRQVAPWKATLLRAAAVAGGAIVGPFARLAAVAPHDSGSGMSGKVVGFILVTTATWLIVGGMGSALLRMAADTERARERLLRAGREREALETRKLEAQLLALQAQIEPHFLFNTLAHVKRLYEIEPGRGRDMLLGLIGYLRAALPGMRESGSTLGRELELARSFLTILQLRMGARLQFEIRADDALLEAGMPPMVIATLVENAIKHGLAPQPEGGRILISAAQADDGRLRVEVEDDGAGFVAAGGSGVGLANTRSRLAALFGERAALELAAGEVRGVIARVVLPLRVTAVPAHS